MSDIDDKLAQHAEGRRLAKKGGQNTPVAAAHAPITRCRQVLHGAHPRPPHPPGANGGVAPKDAENHAIQLRRFS